MATKTQTYTELAVKRTAAATGSYEEWTSFLTVAARVYKYPFLEQLMIYVQRPDATACAGYEVWTRRMHRSIRHGTQGIALVYAQDGKPAVRYVFDVADTIAAEDALTPNPWQYEPEHQQAVSAALEAAFQTPGDSGLPVQVAYIAARLADGAWQKYGDKLLHYTAENGLSGYSEDKLREAFQDAVSASATFMVLSRCGLHPEQFFGNEDFAHAYEYKTYRTVLVLGTAVSEVAETILRCIEDAVGGPVAPPAGQPRTA